MNKNDPLVSIILNCKNGERYLKKALESILNQTYKNWELIFFDNLSNDRSKEIFLSYQTQKFYYYCNEKETNLSIARNRAIKFAKGEYVTIIDHDDWWKNDKLEKQIKCIKKNNVDFVFTDFYQVNNNSKKLIKSKINGDIYKSLLKNYNIGLNTIMISKNILSTYKFDENFHIIGDFSLILSMSKKIAWKRIKEPTCYYRIHENNESFKNIELHISELKKWYLKNFMRIEHNKKIRKLFYQKIIYMKFIKNLKNKNYEFINNFKKTNFFSIYKIKQFVHLIIFYMKNLTGFTSLKH